MELVGTVDCGVIFFQVSLPLTLVMTLTGAPWIKAEMVVLNSYDCINLWRTNHCQVLDENIQRQRNFIDGRSQTEYITSRIEMQLVLWMVTPAHKDNRNYYSSLHLS